MSLEPEFKIIADHLRSSCFLIADGVMPSNEGRGYVLRRIMRRAMRQINKLGHSQPIMHKLVDTLINEMGDQYQELVFARETIIETLKNEEEKFQETLEKGLKILFESIEEIINNKSNKSKLCGSIAFKLYDTFGFPLDLTQDICKEKNIEVDVNEFEKEMNLQRERARKNWVGSGEASEDKLFFDLKEKFGATKSLYHQTTKTSAKILAIFQNYNSVDYIDSSNNNINDSIFAILDQTPFYATSGGQKGDDGNLVLSSEIKDQSSLINYNHVQNCIDISETKKYAGGLFVHFLSDFKGKFKVGDEVLALVNNRHRQLRAQNHSATHLLHKALKQVLGNSITQKGSNVDFKQLTFDFNFNRAMTKLEIDQVEDLVNFYIRQNSMVETSEMELEDARKSGAEALFGEKYDAKVRVVKMGPSSELCGGTHVNKTGNIGIFKIIFENGIASGIRRITAKSGFYALQHLKLQEQKLYKLLDAIKVKQQFDDIKIDDNEFLSNKTGFNDLSFFNDENNSIFITLAQQKSIDEALNKIEKIGIDINNILKTKDKEIDKLKKQIWQYDLQNLKNEKIFNFNFAHHIFFDTNAKDLRDIISEIKNSPNYSKTQILVFFGIENEKVSVCLSLSNDLTQHFDASKLIAPIIDIIGGKGGGGKKDFAMGAGSNSKQIDLAVTSLKNLILKHN
ncbi:MAG: alanine--tRNA ligase [Alphaproteobacteria bacterium]|nr:alanine--tRNA ligase [Alphaproteobacteria bacterium]